jgi:hypothetical protein
MNPMREIERTTISDIIPDSEVYKGKAIGVYKKGIGDLIIIADSKSKAEKAMIVILGDKDAEVNKDNILDVAVIKSEDILQ